MNVQAFFLFVLTIDRVLAMSTFFVSLAGLLLVVRSIYYRQHKIYNENYRLTQKVEKLKSLIRYRERIFEDRIKQELSRANFRENYGNYISRRSQLPYVDPLEFLFDELLARNRKFDNAEGYSRFTPADLPTFKQIFWENASTLKALYNTEEIENNVLSWTMLLQSVFSRNPLPYRVPGYKFTTYGFLNLNYPNSLEDINGYHFGIIIHADLNAWNISLHMSELRAYDPLVIDTIDIDEYRFPVFVNFLEEMPHCASPYPLNGKATCIAEAQASDAGYNAGILTAKHVTGSSIGTEIELGCGRKGLLVDTGPEGIDAAVIECDDCQAGRNTAIFPLENITQWSTVSFESDFFGTVNATVTSCENPLGIFDSPLLPLKIIMNRHGSEGDSGSLVLDNITGKPIGIYIAGYKDRAGRTGGIAQHLFQVTEIMKLKLYK